MEQEAAQISQIIETGNRSDNTANSTVSYDCHVGVRQLFLTLPFFFFLFFLIQGGVCYCYIHGFVAVSCIVVRTILDLKIMNPPIISSP